MFDRSKLDLAAAMFTVAGKKLTEEIEAVQRWCADHGTSDDDSAWESCFDRVQDGIAAVSIEELPDIPAETEEPEGTGEENDNEGDAEFDEAGGD
jgi:chromosome condensin MukBEF MukE localization factor